MPAQPPFAARLVGEARRAATDLDVGRILPGEAINDFLHLSHRAAIDGAVVTPGEELTAAVESAVDLLSEFPVVAAALAVGVRSASRTHSGPTPLESGSARHRAAAGADEPDPLAEVVDRAVAAVVDVEDLNAEHARNLSRGVSDLGILERLTTRFPVAADSAAEGPETGIEIQYVAALAHRGEGEALIARIEALPSNAHQAVVLSGSASRVGAGVGHGPGVRELVLERADLVDWSEVPEALDRHVLALLRDHPDKARALLERWALAPTTAEHAAGRDAMRNQRVSSLLAWAVGDPALAVRIAGMDDVPPGEGTRDPNPASDLVLGLLGEVAGFDWEGRAERLIRTARPADDDFFRRLIAASRLLLAHGEPLAAACLFFVMRKMRWGGYARPHYEYHAVLRVLGNHMAVDDAEQIALVKDLQSAGVPGTIRFDSASFTDPTTSDVGRYLPVRLADLRSYVASLGTG